MFKLTNNMQNSVGPFKYCQEKFKQTQFFTTKGSLTNLIDDDTLLQY